MVTAPPEAPEGERLARLEAIAEALVREIGDIKADIRDLRAIVMRLIFVVVAMWITVILTVLFRT